MIRETIERSRSYNKAEIAIHKIPEFIHLEFEGISTKSNKLTCLLDRGLIDTHLDSYFSSGKVYTDLKENEPSLDIKIQIAKRLRIPYLFVVYNYSESKCKVLDVCSQKVYPFNSFAAFGDWFSENFTDNSRAFSRYQESGLPKIDYELRKNGTPWPGNIDDVLIDKKTGDIYCVAEYQNTSKCSIRLHDNNDYLKASRYRKGDNKRWMVQYVFANGLGTKNVVFVWSTSENEIGVKRINSFNLDRHGLVWKINWGKADYIKCEDLTYSKIRNVVD